MEATGIPAFTVEQARGMIDDEHPLCFGYADGALNAAARRFREADVVLLLGKRLDHRYRYGQVFGPEAQADSGRPGPGGNWPQPGRSRRAAGRLGGAITEQLTAAAGAGSKADKSAWVAQLAQDREAWLNQMRGPTPPARNRCTRSMCSPH